MGASLLLQTTTEITGQRAEDCWALYLLAFEELRTAAVQRHVMLRAEFDAVLTDGRVTKYVAVDEAAGGRVARWPRRRPTWRRCR